MRHSHWPRCASALPHALTLTALMVAAGGLLPAPTHAQTTLPVWFDDNPDPNVKGFPIGSGTFTYHGKITDGLWTASEMGGVSFDFDFFGSVFTENDSLYPLDNTLFLVTTTAKGTRIQFTDHGKGAGGFGSGSLDLINANGDGLSFEPSYFDAGLTLFATYNPNFTAFGKYYVGADAVPEPTVLPFALLASAGIITGVIARKRKS